MMKNRMDKDYLLKRYNHCLQEISRAKYFLEYLKLLHMSDKQSLIREISRLNEIINRNDEEAKRLKKLLDKDDISPEILNGNKIHIEADASRVIGVDKRGFPVLQDYDLSFDLFVTKPRTNEELKEIYAKVYNAATALIIERGARAKYRNMVAAIHEATGLKYVEDFEIFNFFFDSIKDDSDEFEEE